MEPISITRKNYKRVTSKEQKLVKSTIRKKKLCIEYHRTGVCKYGDNCKYLHGEITEETKQLVNSLQKTQSDKLRREQTNQLKLRESHDILLHKLVTYFNDAQLTKQILSPVLQNYTRLFIKRQSNTLCFDQYVLLHSNGICIIGIAEAHSMIRDHHICKLVTWGTTHQHRLIQSNEVSGKSKKGGIWLDEDDVVCTLVDENHISYPVISGIRGRLIEVNERIVQDPSLVSSANATKGYIGIVQPKVTDYECIIKGLLSLDEYVSAITSI